MRSYFQILLLCGLAINLNAQVDELPSFNIGDPVPQLQVKEWVKGKPVQQFERGMVYVLEYWATWCKPCKAAMPRLSNLARQYKGKVTFIGIDIYENANTPSWKIKTFVDSMGSRLDYHVAIQDSNMLADWIYAAKQKDKGIPRTFLVNGDGMLAWIGHPKDLDTILFKVVNKTWDIKAALARHNLNRHLEHLDREASFDLMEYNEDPYKPGDLGNPGGMLLKINEIVEKEPGLKYAPIIAYNTFSSLLKTDMKKAYEYGKMAIITPTYEDPAYSFIISAITRYSDQLTIPPGIYRLGAEAYQAEIDNYPYPENIDIAGRYRKIAEWYLRANDKLKADAAEQKAVETENSRNKQ